MTFVLAVVHINDIASSNVMELNALCVCRERLRTVSPIICVDALQRPHFHRRCCRDVVRRVRLGRPFRYANVFKQQTFYRSVHISLRRVTLSNARDLLQEVNCELSLSGKLAQPCQQQLSYRVASPAFIVCVNSLRPNAHVQISCSRKIITCIQRLCQFTKCDVCACSSEVDKQICG